MLRKFLFAFLVLTTQQLIAQCSDAGVCMIGSGHDMKNHRIGVSYTFGTSTKSDDLTFHSLQIEGSFTIMDDARLTVRMPWGNAKGPQGSTGGIGDLTLLWTQSVIGMPGDGLSVQVGAKIATGADDANNLPQAYQPGLGTNDFLLGVSYDISPMSFALGYQLSTGRSKNSLTKLDRGDDLFGRVGYTAHVSDATFGLELLAIKRLHESTVLNHAVPGANTFVSVPRSDQFQINVVGSGTYPIDSNYDLQIMAALPLRSRNVNIDGLTRSVSLSAGVQYSF